MTMILVHLKHRDICARKINVLKFTRNLRTY